MHQLAIALKLKGYAITGSDDEIFEPASSNLHLHGILPEALGWFPNKINKDLDAVILGMHARADNSELIRATELGMAIYSFPEYILQESKTKTRVAIGGSHGKTTTTAMIMHVLKKFGQPFDYLVGARLEGFNQSVNISDAPILISEADEYPASALQRIPKFHFLFPHIAVITGIAWDHINVFPTYEGYVEQFSIFINKIEPNGVLIYNESDEELNKVIKSISRIDIRLKPYQLPEFSIEKGITTLGLEGEKTDLKVFGNHNLLNIHAAFLVCKELGVSAKEFTTAISDFTGAAKRLELIYESDSTNVYRDFAHAPSKVKASIAAVKQQFPSRQLIAVIELHTYSSLNEAFMTEYNGAAKDADICIVFYSSHALEIKRMPPLPEGAVKKGFNKENLVVITDKTELEEWLHNHAYENTNILLMSSGNYDGLDVMNLIAQS
jgi:UDP-N-acetylmuramate: L-alanyl-gamma-D-glutamyl-meso-diaminopimelate ligase